VKNYIKVGEKTRLKKLKYGFYQNICIFTQNSEIWFEKLHEIYLIIMGATEDEIEDRLDKVRALLLLLFSSKQLSIFVNF